MDADPITLPTDPVEALAVIAGYLRETRRDGYRAVWQHGDGREHDLRGYWQTPEYLDGLEDIARECERKAPLFVIDRRVRLDDARGCIVLIGIAFLYAVGHLLAYALR